MDDPLSIKYFLRGLSVGLSLLVSAMLSQPAFSSTIGFASSDVTIDGTPVGNVQFWEVNINLSSNLAVGAVSNPGINEVDYRVNGTLDSGNPSGFNSFDLLSEHINAPGLTPVTGSQFYGNGASLDYIIKAGANLSDGLQISELDLLTSQGYPSPVDDNNAVFVLNAREDGTGRYHPPIVIFRNDGTGQIINSNNTGVNGQTNRDIVAEDGLFFGNEYITNFRFDPNTFTIATTTVPLPGGFLLLFSGLLSVSFFSKKRIIC